LATLKTTSGSNPSEESNLSRRTPGPSKPRIGTKRRILSTSLVRCSSTGPRTSSTVPGSRRPLRSVPPTNIARHTQRLPLSFVAPLESKHHASDDSLAKLVWRVKLVTELQAGQTTDVEAARIERDHQADLSDLGVRLAEAKPLTSASRGRLSRQR
jgi:hypothetical protein